MASLCLERTFATYYVADYDVKDRYWIAGLSVGLALSGSFIASLLLLFEWLTFFHGILLALVATSGIFVYLRYIYQTNRRIRKAMKKLDATGYSLSKRYQIAENIEALRLIFVFGSTCLVFNGFIALCFLAAESFCESGSVWSYAFYELADFMIAVYGMTILAFPLGFSSIRFALAKELGEV
ncbi:unnamed protein product, partial [Mesorhabditis spiculigera]